MYTEISKNKRNSWFLIGGFVIVITLLCYVFALAFNNQAVLYLGVGFAVFYAAISYYFADSMILAVSKAQKIAKKDNPQLYRTVENLSITAGLPMPSIYIIDDTAPNAFATGRDPKHAIVAVTSGLLEKLDKPELEGVIAHELSHVGNYDVRLMALVVVLVAVIVLLSDWFLRFSFIFGDDNDSGGGTFQLIMIVIGIALALLAPLIGVLLQLAISRKREYLADASGAMLTRYPEGLAKALRKIEGDTEPLEAANRATENLYIINPLRDNVHGHRSWFAGLFSTHPPTAERIKRLESMDLHP
ncbi:M48 family metallopeptidase [Candidatus Saccharibacteria bacterium]|nr:M48 family metallopeptidase [Candidatus Saccharibacteria bacterium]